MARTPALVSTSASGSIHNRLVISNSSSARRLRALSVVESDNEKLAEDSVIAKAFCGPSPVLNSPTLPLYDVSRSTSHQKQNISYWIVLSYGILSMCFFTARLLNISRFLQHASSSLDVPSMPLLSPIHDFSASYRLSKILPLKPDPISLRPFVTKSLTNANISDVTACLWTTDEEIQKLERWSAHWKGKSTVDRMAFESKYLPGPISVVVSTNKTPETVLTKLKGFQHPIWFSGNMAVHIVQKSPQSTNPSNSYLNIARLLAHTQYVLLFPSSPPLHLLETIYNRSISKIISNKSETKHPHLIVPEKLTSHTSFPFHFSPPLLLEQSHPIWCSERFFTAPSREEDWEECIWQFWLNSHGSLQSFNIPNWKNQPSPKTRLHSGSVYVSWLCSLIHLILFALTTPPVAHSSAS